MPGGGGDDEHQNLCVVHPMQIEAPTAHAVDLLFAGWGGGGVPPTPHLDASQHRAVHKGLCSECMEATTSCIHHSWPSGWYALHYSLSLWMGKEEAMSLYYWSDAFYFAIVSQSSLFNDTKKKRRKSQHSTKKNSSINKTSVRFNGFLYTKQPLRNCFIVCQYCVVKHLP